MWRDEGPLKLFLSYLRNRIKPLPFLEHPDGAAGVDSAPSTTTEAVA
jgi:hypothetical protein